MLADVKKRASHRSKIIEGQFKALQAAIDNDSYCVDVLTQSLAIQKALQSLNKLVLENHMRTHVADGMSTGSTQQKDKLITEMMELYELSNVRG